MNIAKKIFSIILNILMCLIMIVLIFAIYSFFQINVLNKKYVNVFGYTFLQVKTGSMEDTIKVEDIVIDKIIKSDEVLNKDDIISFEEDGVLITHRIVKIEDNGMIITKGDANNLEDDPIERNKVVRKSNKNNTKCWNMGKSI